MSQIFISYARKDHFFVDRMREDLAREDVKYWIDHEGLSPGTRNWERAIRKAIADSYAMIWVVSPASYDSEYVSSEIAVAEMHKLKIYPVFADGDNWIACVPLGKHNIQFVDMRHDKYRSGLDDLLTALEGNKPDIALPEPETPKLPDGTDPRNPYKGLLAFTENDSDDFFGREALIEKLKRRVLNTIEAKSDRFLAVLGASGAGKSSVVMAGLIPSLRKSHENWTILPKIVPGTHPVEALADSLYSAMPDKSLSAIETDLNSPSGRMLHRLANQIEGEQVILYIDQFEELFTLTDDEDERHQFINLITHSVTEPDGKVIVILSMRADFYGHPANYPELGRLVNQNSDLVLPMNISELRDAIEKPARLADVGLTFDSGLVAEIIFALRERDKALAGALPLLQFTLERLFEERDGTNLTWETYNSLGNPEQGISGVEGAIGTHCEVVFSKLPENVQAKIGQVFLPLVNIDESSGEATRRRALQSAVIVDNETELFVKRFIENRLLQTGQENETVYIEITHEALFRSWSRLKEWIASAQEDLILLRQVKNAAEEWHRRGEDYLRWNHERLSLVYKMIEHLQPELTYIEKAFIEPEQERLYRELKTLERIPEQEGRRRDIGNRLAFIGDTREGVGTNDGLPDIVWLPVLGGRVDRGSFIINNKSHIVNDLFIAKFLTTYIQYQTFVDAEDGYKNIEWWQEIPSKYQVQELQEQRTKSANNPRDNLSFAQAVAFSRWLNSKFSGIKIPKPAESRAFLMSEYMDNHNSISTDHWIIGKDVQIRLPAEWEWEWVARNGVDGRSYPWGNKWRKGYANTAESGLGRAIAVGMYPHAAAVCGALDMSGNLLEWCERTYFEPTNDIFSDFGGGTMSKRYLRGGSFYFNKNAAKSSIQYDINHDRNNYGMRLVIAPILPVLVK